LEGLNMTMTIRLFSPALLAVLGVILRLIKPAVAQPIIKIPVEIPRSGFNPLLPNLEMEVYHPALVQALGFNKEAILKKIWDWQEHNHRERQTFRDGHYWTYYTYEQWQQKHFQWLNVDTVRKLIRELENDGLLISGQFSYGSATKWYRVDVKAVSKLILRAEKTSTASGQKRRKAGEDTRKGGEKARIKTTGNLQFGDPQIKTTSEQQQPLQDESDVVVDLPSSEPEAESGEHNIDGEGQDTTAVKAFMPHEQHQDKEPISKVPLKVLSPLAAELISFGVTSAGAQQMVQQYAEGDIRYVLKCARAATNLTNPPGFVVRELEKGAAGVLGLRDLQKDLQPKRDPLVVAWEEEMRRNMEQMIADDLAAQAAADPEFA
jgi:hypothetical protein